MTRQQTQKMAELEAEGYTRTPNLRQSLTDSGVVRKGGSVSMLSPDGKIVTIRSDGTVKEEKEK